MKKQILFCGLAVASAVVALAATEKIDFVKNGKILKTYRVENISDISYQPNEEDPQLFKKININLKDGSVDSYSLAAFDRMAYTAPLPANPLNVDIELHYQSATFDIKTSDPEAYYRFSGMPVKNLQDLDHAEWAEYLVQDDLDYIYAAAEQNGQDLATIDPLRIFDQGDQVREWFPSEIISDETPIAVAAYTAKINEEGIIEITTEPLLLEFTTKKLEDLGVKFDIDWKMNSTELEITATAVDSDIPFCIELYDAYDVLQYDLPALVYQTLANYERFVYLYGGSWDDLTYRGTGTRTYSNKRMGDIFLAVAFGCEHGIANTDASQCWIIIPEPEVTDECTFDVSSTQLSASEVQLNVAPSDPETRYVTFMVASSKLNEELTPEQWVSNRIYWYKSTNQLDLTDPEGQYVRYGDAVLNSHDDCIDGEYMQIGVDYTFITCGLAEDGGRNTVCNVLTTHTEEVQHSDELTFEINLKDFNDEYSFYHYITWSVTPSDPDAKYVAAWMPSSNAYANTTKTDEKFIKDYVEVQGGHLVLNTGTVEKKESMGQKWSSAVMDYIWEPYIFAVFGYDGAATTPLYLYSIDSETGEVTQLRGPNLAE